MGLAEPADKATADLYEGAFSYLKLRSRHYIALKGKGGWIVGKGDLDYNLEASRERLLLLQTSGQTCSSINLWLSQLIQFIEADKSP